MPADTHALLMDEMVKRAVAQQIQQEDAQPKPLTAPPPVKRGTPDKFGLAALLAGGAADVGSTIYGLKSGTMRENNPLLRGMDPKIGIPLGAALETGGVMVARKLLKGKHPTLLNVLESVLGAGHGALAVKNLRGTREAPIGAPGPPPNPGLVWHPDGYWWNPDAFQH